MSVTHHLSETDYVRIVLADLDHKWELVEGQLREKPGMSWDHNRIIMRLGRSLLIQIDLHHLHVYFESRVRWSSGNIFIPDIAVIPVSYGEAFVGRPGVLAIISQPLPLVVEVWSSSTGTYDVDMKIPEYQQRGDQEIWRIHPYERTLTAWVRQPDGSYEEMVYREGSVILSALPEVAIDLGELFDV